MTTLIVVLIVIIALFFLLTLKVGVRAAYDSVELDFKLQIGVFRFSFREKTADTKKSKSENTSVKKQGKRNKRKQLIYALLERRTEIIALVGRVLTSPSIDLLDVNIEVGHADPVECAVRYGQICAAVGAFVPVIENTFVIKKRDVNVNCNFEKEKISVQGKAVLTLRVYEIFALAAAVLRLGLGIYKNLNMNKKVRQSP